MPHGIGRIMGREGHDAVIGTGYAGLPPRVCPHMPAGAWQRFSRWSGRRASVRGAEAPSGHERIPIHDESRSGDGRCSSIRGVMERIRAGGVAYAPGVPRRSRFGVRVGP